MSYSDNIKSKAFMLYAQGFSFAEIAARLKGEEGASKLTKGAIRRWAEKPDDLGRTWKDRKRDISLLVQESETEAAVRQRKELVKDSGNILSEIMDEIRSGSLEFKTKDAAIYAFKALADWQAKTLDKDSKAGDMGALGVIQTMLEIFAEVPDVRAAVQLHWPHIEREIKKRILAEGGTGQAGGKDNRRRLPDGK